MKIKGILKEELLKYKGELFGIILFQVLVIVAATFVPKFSGWFLDALAGEEFQKAKEVIIILIVVAVIHELAAYFKSVIGGGYKERVSANVIERMILHLQKIPLLKLKNKDAVALSQQISMDASMSVALVTDFFMAIAYCVLVIVISVVNLALTNWLTLIPLLIFAVAYIVSYFMYKEKISDTMTYFVEAQNDFFSKQTEQLEKAKTIRGNGAEGFFYNRTQKAIERLVIACKGSYKSSSGYTMINNVVCRLSIAGLWAMAIVLVVDNKISLGSFVAISAFYEMVISETKNLTEAIVFVRQTKTSLDRLEALAIIEEEEAETVAVQQVTNIQTKDLSFGYSDAKIIDSLNLKLEKGKIYLLKGINGKGKSTLLNILSGLYSGYDGNVLYDGNDLHQIKKKNTIGIVEQEPLTVSGTIRDNLTLGIERTVDDTEITEWLKKYKLEKLCDRLDEKVDGLSGGEKQKISIIRMLIKNPEVMFFDEATSALDTASTLIVRDELERIKKEKIIIMIEHGEAMDGIADQVIAI